MSEATYPTYPYFTLQGCLDAAWQCEDKLTVCPTDNLKEFIVRAEGFQADRKEKGYANVPTINRVVDMAKKELANREE